MLSLHHIASDINRLYVSVLIMIVNQMAISLNSERKLCLTFGLRNIIQLEHQAENGKEKEIRLIKDSGNENNYLLLTDYLDHLCICSLHSSLHTLRHKAFSAICEKRRIFVFTWLMNTNGTVFCSYRTKRRWREFPISDWQFKNCRLRFALRIDLTVTKIRNNSV